MSVVYDFVAHIEAVLGHGPKPEQVVAGKYVRFSTTSKKSKRSGWCRLWDDELGGIFGDFREGGPTHSWSARQQRRLTAREVEERRRDFARASAKRDAQELEKQAAAAARAARIWESAVAVAVHAYLERKVVNGRGLRVQYGHFANVPGAFYRDGDDGRRVRMKGLILLVPMKTIDGLLHSLQGIDETGEKCNMTGGRIRGCFHLIGADQLDETRRSTVAADITVCEGYATGATIFDLTSAPVFVAFSAGNLEPVARAVRAHLPLARITIAGDVDRSGTGQAAALNAARAVGGFVSLPPFTADDINAGDTDWNDFVRRHPDGDDQARQA